MEDSSDEENNILKDMGFSNKIIGRINKKTRLKNIFSLTSSSNNPPVFNSVRKHKSDKEVVNELACVSEGSSAIESCS